MKNTITFLFAISVYSISYGQSSMRPNIYFQELNFYNPASISFKNDENFSVLLYGKHNFVENEDYIWDKPAIYYINHTGTIKKEHSFYAVAFLNDRYSFYNRNSISGGYARLFKWGKSSELGLSVRMVMNFFRINWDKFELPSDESGKTTKTKADLDLGVQYRLKGLTIGLSAKNLFQSSIKSEDADFLVNQKEFYLNALYLFRFGKNFQLAPYIQIYKEIGTEFDAGLYLGLFERIGLSYQLRLIKIRNIFSLRAQLTESLNVGVAFDYSSVLPDKNLDLILKYSF